MKYCNYCKTNISKSTYYENHVHGYCIKRAIRQTKNPVVLQKSNANDIELDNSSDIDMESMEVENTSFLEDGSENPEALEKLSDNEDQHNTTTYEPDNETEIWDEENGSPYEDFAIEQTAETFAYSQTVHTIVKTLFLLQIHCFLSDSSLEYLLKTVKFIIFTVNIGIKSEIIDALLLEFPTTLYKARKILGINRDDFEKRVICPKCETSYSYGEAYNSIRGILKSKQCSYVEFPNHTQKRFRKPCGTVLMKSVLSIDGSKTFLYPKKVHCYRNIKSSLEELLKRNGFKEKLHKGPSKSTHAKADMCDGSMYHDFKDNEGSPFFNDKRNIGVLLNVDWFNPFKNSEYSLGAIYLVLINLPREERFKWENVILLGLTPGPCEPKLTINSYLKPHVDELIMFWNGMTVLEDSKQAFYKLALFCISSDVPATRKCGGFLAHNANKGCSKCFHEFSRDESNRPDYSGYDTSSWVLRNGDEHKHRGFASLQFNTLEQKKSFESANGLRYSDLYRLPYFDPVKMHVIDPMHNLMLGVAKHTFKTWIDVGKLNDKQLGMIDDRQNRIKVPSDIGRIAHSISKVYKTMTADEWKNWTLVYSMFCLRDVLPVRDLNVWSMFVKGCILICRRAVTMEQAAEAHEFFKCFCINFTELYGSLHCVPNMHLMLHLYDCIAEYGSIYSFWCFSFERYNGIMGNYHINNSSIEIQVMRKFVTSKGLVEDSCDEDSISSTCSFEINRKLYTVRHSTVFGTALEFQCEKPLSVIHRFSLPQDEIYYLNKLFKTLYPNENIVRIALFANKVSRVMLANEVLACSSYRGGSSSFNSVLAKFMGVDVNVNNTTIRPAFIKTIFQVKVIVLRSNTEVSLTHWIAEMEWLRKHPFENYYGVNSPTKIWNTQFEEYSVASYIPMKFITGRFVYCRERISFANPQNFRLSDDVNVIIPLPSKSIAV